jgi:hypothetical protein
VRGFSLALYQVEVLFVLSTLCSGKQKRQAQDLLAALRLGSADIISTLAFPPQLPRFRSVLTRDARCCN